MPKLTPREAREKHARNLKASVPDIRAGVARVTISPTAKAADKVDKMRAKLMEAFDSGKVERGLRRVTLEEWKTKMTDKGINNIATGVDLSADKIERFFAELFPYQESLQARISAMPDLTLEDSVARASTWIREMAKFQRS